MYALRQPSTPFTPLAVAAFLTLAAAGVQAQSATPAAAATTAGTLQTVTVNASADASAEGLTKPYAGGQVARGGRVGVLGNQDNMDSPFAVTSFTNELIQNQQARSVGDVLQNDPSIRVARGFGNFQESYFIRGFLLGSDFVAYNGLYSLLPRQYISSELFERVEVLHGASTFLTGITPGGDGIGGTVNLLPKRATNEPLSQVTLGGAKGGQFYGAVDLSRRFGPDNSTGIRINAAHRDGGTGIDREKVKLDVVSVGLDWRSANARLSADIGYQDHRLSNTRTNVTLSGLTSVPGAPNASRNWAQPGSYSNERDTFGSLRGEYDINDKVTAWFAAGARNGTEANSLGNLMVNNANGNGTTYRFDNTGQEQVRTGEIGIRAKIQTGVVKHNLVASAAYFGSERNNAYTFDFGNQQTTNLYNPVLTTLPPFSATAGSGGVLSDPVRTNKKDLSSFALGDTLAFLDDTLLFTVGARFQQVTTYDYAYGTGVRQGKYDANRTSPAAGVVFKLRPDVSLYANYIEQLSPGATAPANSNGVPVSNAGQTLSPYVAKQKEVGVKYDGGKLGASAAFFSTDRPRQAIVQGTTFASVGKDNHQGVELNAFGEPLRGLRILGGVTLLDTEQKNTGDATTTGKRVIGVPTAQGAFNVEYDIPFVPGLAVNARVTANKSSYADSANNLRVPGWTRIDAGARYTTAVQGKLVTIRGRVDNLADRNYWASVGGYSGSGYLVLGAPRTFSLTASVEF
ncbi:TonB-dependent receptor [Xylophilus sp. GOD-11R]|uniref:TonB-dependent receptor n=1 Tax=Xylophilus sp. GOD-11R TaxID=3089814 RepID=UPI00298CCE1A|nr:TonB-dependent receptor [Xylophilus sp. GOD-11R]WPB58002.1 TonB-dependent receptor [Xylophilus sp. GOD-11R]